MVNQLSEFVEAEDLTGGRVVVYPLPLVCVCVWFIQCVVSILEKCSHSSEAGEALERECADLNWFIL